MFESAGGRHVNQSDLSGSDGNPAESKQGRRVAMIVYKTKPRICLQTCQTMPNKANCLRPLTQRCPRAGGQSRVTTSQTRGNATRAADRDTPGCLSCDGPCRSCREGYNCCGYIYVNQARRLPSCLGSVEVEGDGFY